MTPTQYLEESGMFGQAHVLLAHGVHLNPRISAAEGHAGRCCS